MRYIDTIIIHCADTLDGSTRFTIADIDQWHRARGFARELDLVLPRPELTSVGYHAVILCDGTIQYGRGDEEVGAHAAGNNHGSLGVCLMGRSRYTREQWGSLRDTVQAWQRLYQQIARVIGHNEVSIKACPGFDVRAWMAGDCRALAGHIL